MRIGLQAAVLAVIVGITAGCGSEGQGQPEIQATPRSLTFAWSLGGAPPASQTVRLQVGGALPPGGTTIEARSGLVTVTPRPADAASWALEVSPGPGALSRAAGTYGDEIRVSVPGAANSPLDVAVTLVVASPVVFTVSGAIDGLAASGGTVDLTGDATATATVSSSGRFEFPSLSAGNYVVTPVVPGWVFTPAFREVRVVDANVGGQDFTASVCGVDGTACCPGDSCHGDLACRAGACRPACGARSEACCPGLLCDGALFCVGGACLTQERRCGQDGEACCLGNTCGAGLACRANLCEPPGPSCGGPTQPCCETGAACSPDSGLICDAGTCVAAPATCATTPDFRTLTSAVGSMASDVAVADVNGDGYPDLAVANGASSAVTILLGDGAGGFTFHVSLATGSNAAGLVAADFNGDGVVDLAVSAFYSNTVGVFLGNGDGTFQPRQDFATGQAPWGLAVADLDGDGVLDLAVANNASGTVSILAGLGDGTFTPVAEIPVGRGPQTMAVADFDSDGLPDLAVVNNGDATVTVVLAPVSGGAPRTATYGVGNEPTSVAAADLDGDGVVDLATSDWADSTVSVLLGNLGGTFRPRVAHPTGTRPAAVAAGDLNGDEIVDLVTANSGSGDATVMLGRGDGTLGSRTNWPTGSTPSAVRVADVTGNGRVSVAMTNWGSGSVSVLSSACSAGAATCGRLLGPCCDGRSCGEGLECRSATCMPMIPVIQDFRMAPLPDGSAELTAVFENGVGTITPDVGPVASGVPVVVRPIVTTTYKLKVSNAAADPVTGFLSKVAPITTAESHPIKGRILGLTSPGLVLGATGQPDLSVPAGATRFEFDHPYLTDRTFDIGVVRQPEGLVCAVVFANGFVSPAPVDDSGPWPTVECNPPNQVAAGWSHSIAILDDGTTWAWGENRQGQLGDGTFEFRDTVVPLGSGFVQVAAGGAHNLAIRIDGTLWAWGSNTRGQLGDGTHTDRARPVQIGSDSDWAHIAAGDQHSLAVKQNGTLWAWGANGNGQVGDGTGGPNWREAPPPPRNYERLLPVQVGQGIRWRRVAAGRAHSLALADDGQVWGWGDSTYRQVGACSGTEPLPGYPPYMAFPPITFASPCLILHPSRFKEIAAGSDRSVGISPGGTIWEWGRAGRVVTLPTAPFATATDSERFGAAAVAGDNLVAVGDTGLLEAYGINEHGELGDGRPAKRCELPWLRPHRLDPWAALVAVAGGSGHVIAKQFRTLGGLIQVWGDNGHGQLGTRLSGPSSWIVPGIVTRPTRVPYHVFGRVAAGRDFSAAIDPDLRLSTWGSAKADQLGAGAAQFQDRGTPRVVGSPFTKVFPGRFSSTNQFAIDPDGGLWAWGYRYKPPAPPDWYGWAGEGYVCPPYSSPVRDSRMQLGAVDVANNGEFALFRTGAGDLWAAGSAREGALGVPGAAEVQVLPLQVDIRDVTSVAVGCSHSLAIGSVSIEGTPTRGVWAWGSNRASQLGRGPVLTRVDYPIRALTGADWVQVAAGCAHSLALGADGTVWAWGSSAYGQVGDGTRSPRVLPKTVATGFRSITAGFGFTVGVRVDGTLWAWGDNSYGQLGDGTFEQRLVPTRIGGDTDWVEVSAGMDFVLALKADGTLWTWGNNSNGQLGYGLPLNGIPRSPPIPWP